MDPKVIVLFLSRFPCCSIHTAYAVGSRAEGLGGIWGVYFDILQNGLYRDYKLLLRLQSLYMPGIQRNAEMPKVYVVRAILGFEAPNPYVQSTPVS